MAHKALLEAAADPNAKTQSGDVAIRNATSTPEILKLLIEHKVDVNLVSSSGDTPLIAAIRNGESDGVKLLLDAGADVSKPDNYGNFALSVAESAGTPEIVALLKEKSPNTPETVNGNKTYPATEGMTDGKCTIVDAARKQMELHGKLQKQVDSGKMSSEIFRTFNKDTENYSNLLVDDPAEACRLYERRGKKYGVSE